MNESNLMRAIMLALSDIRNRAFRNNTGMAWQGNGSFTATKAMTINIEKGDVVIKQGRIVHFGLCKGSSDIIGFRSVTVTPEMVGKPVAVFTAVEVKTASGKATTEQQAFIDMVNKMGGIGVVARSEQEAKDLVNGRVL